MNGQTTTTDDVGYDDLDDFPDPIDKELIRKRLIDRFLTPKRRLPPHWLKDWQIQWPYTPDPQELYFSEAARPTAGIEFTTVGLEGKITGWRETSNTASAYMTASTSTSVAREPQAYSAKGFVRGVTGHFPFTPGGLDANNVAQVAENAEDAFEDIVAGLQSGNSLGRGGIRMIPPGLERGLDFDMTAEEQALLDSDESARIEPIYRPSADGGKVAPRQSRQAIAGLDAEVERLLPTERLSLAAAAVARKRPAIAKRDWAHVVDVNQELVNFRELVPDMAREYPFELDTFQKEAVYHLELGDSVFVAAHTSAGKTVVAEYAIALAARHMTRAIYTSPIKALSNQKYRDFKETFGAENVGILTGDVQINAEAGCLIMTTEILRSMLYKGADLIRDVEWVIFDEVHYVNDLERGVVWEEVIIMLPDHVGIILLSATVPNTKEFADWVGRTKKKDIYVISTPKRPVPLEHFLYAGKELHKIVDSRGVFDGQGWKEANEALKRKQDKEREAAGLGPLVRQGAKAATANTSGRGTAVNGRGGATRGGNTGGRGRGTPALANAAVRGAGTFGPVKSGIRTTASQDKQIWVHLIGMLRKKELLPVVVFSFSKKRCEDHADSLPNQDLCGKDEKSEIHVIIERSLTRLKGSDKKLPQIAKMRQLLSRGIGVHHGGLLPIVKEMVELLFSRGLVKVLFATETFAMGVNMPARTVVFGSIRKHDGRQFRDLLAGEYTQMSGRAGRRGLDKTGVVIILCNENEPPDTATLQTMILGQPTRLTSQFRLTYTMILNLLRVEALRVEEMIKRSFSENASQRLMPDQQKKVLETEKQLQALPKLPSGPNAATIQAFYDCNRRLLAINDTFMRDIQYIPAATKLLVAGRVVVLSDETHEDLVAVILRGAPSVVTADGHIDRNKAFEVLVYRDSASPQHSSQTGPRPPIWPPRICTNVDDLRVNPAVAPVTSIVLVSRLQVKLDLDRVYGDAKQAVYDSVLSEGSTVIKQLMNDPTSCEADWSKIRSIEVVELLRERKRLSSERAQLDVSDEPDFDEKYRAVHAYRLLEDKVAGLRQAISEQNLELLPDYEQRVSVLQDLQFIDEKSTVLLKGRVACEINTGHELVLTELILDNFLAKYEPQEVVALLSCFVFQERRSETEPVLSDRLKEGQDRIMQIAEMLHDAQVARRANVADSGPEANELKFGLAEVVYEWARGMPFDEITHLTDVQEGTIVRTITRLDETCREVRDAARVIGDAALYQKMEACQACIKRDIVFCASLYL